jgi:hypothetical protein
MATARTSPFRFLPLPARARLGLRTERGARTRLPEGTRMASGGAP